MEDLRSKGVEGCVVPPDPGIGVEGGSADVAGRWEGGELESGWVLVGFGEHPK
jgi:hypothetical protein